MVKLLAKKRKRKTVRKYKMRIKTRKNRRSSQKVGGDAGGDADAASGKAEKDEECFYKKMGEILNKEKYQNIMKGVSGKIQGIEQVFNHEGEDNFIHIIKNSPSFNYFRNKMKSDS